MAEGTLITLRLTIEDPVPGVRYSLQNKTGEPLGTMVAGHGPISFDAPVRLAPGPRFQGELVRSEGKTRRFIYIAIGALAGDETAAFSRRAKIDIDGLSPALLQQGIAGKVLEATLPGRDKKGDPACATLRPLGPWRALA